MKSFCISTIKWTNTKEGADSSVTTTNNQKTEMGFTHHLIFKHQKMKTSQSKGLLERAECNTKR